VAKRTVKVLGPAELAAIPIVDVRCHAMRAVEERLTATGPERRMGPATRMHVGSALRAREGGGRTNKTHSISQS
jgi:hypothetical protein